MSTSNPVIIDLIIDDLDKMKGEDFSVLLSLMQSGAVARLEMSIPEEDKMTIWIFGGVNRRDRRPAEFLSRIKTFDFKT